MTDSNKNLPRQPIVTKKPTPTSGTPAIRFIDSHGGKISNRRVIDGGVNNDSATRRPDTGSGTKRDREK